MKPSDGADFKRLLRVCEAMDDPDFELTVEEFAGFYVLFRRALAAGAPFDPNFVDRMEAMNAGARGGTDDADDDVSVDDGQEDDDPNDDREDADEIGGNLNPERTDPRRVILAKTRPPAGATTRRRRVAI